MRAHISRTTKYNILLNKGGIRLRLFIYHLFRSPLKLARVSHKRGKRRIRRDLLAIKAALAQEKKETQEMLAIYRKFTQGEATEQEMKVANEQLVDVVKGLGVGVFAALPFAPITIPFIIRLGKRFGIDVLPSAFYEKDGIKEEIKEEFKEEFKEDINKS